MNKDVKNKLRNVTVLTVIFITIIYVTVPPMAALIDNTIRTMRGHDISATEQARIIASNPEHLQDIQRMALKVREFVLSKGMAIVLCMPILIIGIVIAISTLSTNRPKNIGNQE